MNYISNEQIWQMPEMYEYALRDDHSQAQARSSR